MGDSAYALAPFLMKPLANPTTEPERLYQKAILQTRYIVETAFGRLKARWNCLHQKLRYSPERCCKIIAACFALQNFAIRRNMPEFAIDQQEDPEEVVQVDNFTLGYAVDGKVRQAEIIRRYFTPILP